MTSIVLTHMIKQHNVRSVRLSAVMSCIQNVGTFSKPVFSAGLVSRIINTAFGIVTQYANERQEPLSAGFAAVRHYPAKLS